jgi:hypothetical protein
VSLDLPDDCSVEELLDIYGQAMRGGHHGLAAEARERLLTAREDDAFLGALSDGDLRMLGDRLTAARFRASANVDEKAREITACLLPNDYEHGVPYALTAADLEAAMVGLCEQIVRRNGAT